MNAYTRLDDVPTQPGLYYFIGVYQPYTWHEPLDLEAFVELLLTARENLWCDTISEGIEAMTGVWWSVKTPIELETEQAWEEYYDEAHPFDA